MSYLTPKQEIEFINEYILPFISCDNTDKESILKNYLALQESTYKINNLKKEYAKQQINLEKKTDQNAILSLYSFLKFMLLIPLNPTDDNIFAKDYYNDFGNLESLNTIGEQKFYSRICNNIFNKENKPSVVWSGLGNTIICKNPIIPNDSSLKVVECICVNVIANCFHSEIIDENKIELMSNIIWGLPCTEENLNKVNYGIGFKYFSLCSRCGNPYYRQRKSKTNCCRKCANALRVKKYRSSINKQI